MSESEILDEPLLDSQTQDEEAAAQGTSRPRRVCKITGLTLLAGVLILGQVATAYFLIQQSNDIRALQEDSSKLTRDLVILRAVVPEPVDLTMDDLNIFIDKVFTTEAPDKRDTDQTKCQLEVAGSEPDSFRPACDELGLYQRTQCHAGECWCVEPVNGDVIPGSTTNGTASCMH